MTQVLWIASYPKSGNTWMRFLLASYLENQPANSVLGVESSIPDLHRAINTGELLPPGNGQPRLVKTHFLPNVAIMQLYRPVTRKVLYLVRNPRDVLLSLARHLGVPTDSKEHMRRFAETFIQNHGAPAFRDRGGIGSWPGNVEGWADPEALSEHFPGVELLVVRYEDLKADTVEKFREVLEFLDLGGPVRTSDVERAVEGSTLEKMRQVERNSPAPREGLSSFGTPGEFIGQGRSGQSLAFIGDDVEETYRRLLSDGSEFSHTAKRFGYDA